MRMDHGTMVLEYIEAAPRKLPWELLVQLLVELLVHPNELLVQPRRPKEAEESASRTRERRGAAVPQSEEHAR